MIEVFKTNVENHVQARFIISLIINRYPLYVVNFDLEDYDKILRIESEKVDVDNVYIIMLLASLGYDADVLKDNQISFIHQFLQ